jgi:hypothetical protein
MSFQKNKITNFTTCKIIMFKLQKEVFFFLKLEGVDNILRNQVETQDEKLKKTWFHSLNFLLSRNIYEIKGRLNF